MSPPDDGAEHLTATWHEAKAADLLRPEIVDGKPVRLPAERAVATASAHIALAQSLRIAALTRTLAAGMSGLNRAIAPRR